MCVQDPGMMNNKKSADKLCENKKRNLKSQPETKTAKETGRIGLSAKCSTFGRAQRSKDLKVLATNKLDDPIDASPALAGNQLFLRGSTFLYCIAEEG